MANEDSRSIAASTLPLRNRDIDIESISPVLSNLALVLANHRRDFVRNRSGCNQTDAVLNLQRTVCDLVLVCRIVFEPHAFQPPLAHKLKRGRVARLA